MQHAKSPTRTATAAGRRGKHAHPLLARHRGTESIAGFDTGFAALGRLASAGVQLTARAVDLRTDQVLFAVDDYMVMPTAPVGQVLLLVEAATREDPDVLELAELVGATGGLQPASALLARLGLDTVSARAESLGMRRTALLDVVRASSLPVGSARKLTRLFSRLARGEVVAPAVSERVIGWLEPGADRALVARGFRDVPVRFVNRVGRGHGARSEAGLIAGTRGAAAYAVSAYFDDTDASLEASVAEAMRLLGADLAAYVSRGATRS